MCACACACACVCVRVCVCVCVCVRGSARQRKARRGAEAGRPTGPERRVIYRTISRTGGVGRGASLPEMRRAGYIMGSVLYVTTKTTGLWPPVLAMDAPGSCTQPAGTAPSAARRGEPLMRACCHRWAGTPRREGGLNTTLWIFRECLLVWDVEEGLYR